MELVNLLNPVVISLSQTILQRWLFFLHWYVSLSLTVLHLDLLIFTDPSICSTVSFPLINSDHVVVLVSIDFPQTQVVILLCTSWFLIILMLIGVVFEIIWEIFHGRILLKLCYFCCCSRILWADPIWNWCIYLSL